MRTVNTMYRTVSKNQPLVPNDSCPEQQIHANTYKKQWAGLGESSGGASTTTTNTTTTTTTTKALRHVGAITP